MIIYEDINISYDEFINNIIKNRGQWNIENGYYWEGHHIIPRCLGGEGKAKDKHPNIIWLYPKEHFIAHYLLTLKYPNNKSIGFALHCMLYRNQCSNKIEIDSKLYEEARLIASKHNSEFNKEYQASLPKEEKQRKAKIGGQANKKRLLNPENNRLYRQKIKDWHSNQTAEEKQSIYDKVSISLKEWYSNTDNKDAIEIKRLHNQETNKIKAKQWRKEFADLFGHTAEYYRQYGKMKEALDLFKTIKDYDNNIKLELINNFNDNCLNLPITYKVIVDDKGKEKRKNYHQNMRNSKSKYIFYFNDLEFGNIYDLQKYIKNKFNLNFLPSEKLIWNIINIKIPGRTSPIYSKELYNKIKGTINYKEKEI